MAVDIVPALVADVQTNFNSLAGMNPTLQAIAGRIEKGTASMADIHRYSEEVGKALAKSYETVLKPGVLPNDTMYYNIASRLLDDGLRRNHALVGEVARQIQSIIDAADGLGIGAVLPDYPEARIAGLAAKAADLKIDEAIKWFLEPVINNSEAFSDDYMRENAKARSEMGLKTTITRTVRSTACKWCADMAGVYTYGREPPDIYRRHENCRCDVTYHSERKRMLQDVWTKKKTYSTPEELAARRAAQAPRR